MSIENLDLYVYPVVIILGVFFSIWVLGRLVISHRQKQIRKIEKAKEDREKWLQEDLRHAEKCLREEEKKGRYAIRARTNDGKVYYKHFDATIQCGIFHSVHGSKENAEKALEKFKKDGYFVSDHEVVIPIQFQIKDLEVVKPENG